MTYDNREQYPCPEGEHRWPAEYLDWPAPLDGVRDREMEACCCKNCGWSVGDIRELEHADNLSLHDVSGEYDPASEDGEG